MKRKWTTCIGTSMAALGLLLSGALSIQAAEFQVKNPPKLNIPSNIQKVFIDPKLINVTRDDLKLRDEVIESLKKQLNQLGRFQVSVGPPEGFDPNRETVGVIQGDIISGGKEDEGQFTEKAECKGGIAAAVGSLTAAQMTDQGITFSKRGKPCKLPSLTSSAVESGVSMGLSLLAAAGKEVQVPAVDEVLRVYKYKNFSYFAQINLSFTQLGLNRETLAIRSDAASFSRHVINPDSFRNVRESGDGANLVWNQFRRSPVALIANRTVGISSGTNPGSFRGKWYNYSSPSVDNLPEKEKKDIRSQLVQKTIIQFIHTISPYSTKVEIELAEDGNEGAIEKINKNEFGAARTILLDLSDKTGADLYNLGLSFEAEAKEFKDFQEALQYYTQAFEKEPSNELYAKGIGRMEFRIRTLRKSKIQNK